MGLSLQPITLKEANAFVSALHRHHGPVVGWKFGIAVNDGEKVVGVCIVGRPVSRRQQDGWTLEVSRCCTDGAPNACSMLYGAAWRAVKAMGYCRLITYTMPSEGGASLRAAGFRTLGVRKSGNWNVRSRPRVDSEHQCQKELWEAAS